MMMEPMLGWSESPLTWAFVAGTVLLALGGTIKICSIYDGVAVPVWLIFNWLFPVIGPLIVLIYVFLSGSSIVDHGISAMFLSGLLCFWISRFWILVNRGAVHDDPIVFALKDKHSASLLVGMALILVLEQVN